jgi:WD40 repeat protein
MPRFNGARLAVTTPRILAILGLALIIGGCAKPPGNPQIEDDGPASASTVFPLPALSGLPEQDEDVSLFTFAFSPNGRYLVWSGKADSTRYAMVWNCVDKKYVTRLSLSEQVVDFAFPPDSSVLAVADMEGISLWNPTTWKMMTRVAPKRLKMARIAFSPDGKLLAATADRNDTILLEMPRLTTRVTLSKHPHIGKNIAFSPNGQWLVSTDSASSIKVWRVGQEKEHWAFHAHVEPVTERTGVQGAVFAPDNRTLITTGTDGMIRCWDVQRRREVASLAGDIGEVQTLALAPAGKLLAIGSGRTPLLRLDAGRASERGTIGLWDLEKRREVARIEGLPRGVRCLRFSPDGEWLVASTWWPNSHFKAWRVTELLRRER